MGTPIRTILDDLDKSELENQINAKEPALGFKPVSQGTGVGQSANKVHIGWASDGSGLKATVDGTDLGYIYTSAIGKRALSTEGGTVTGALNLISSNYIEHTFQRNSVTTKFYSNGTNDFYIDNTTALGSQTIRLHGDSVLSSSYIVAGNPAVGTSALRNISAGTSALTAGSSTLTTGTIYIQYE